MTTDFGKGANGIVDTLALTTGTNMWQEWDITALVNAWVAGTHEHHGLLLISTAGDDTATSTLFIEIPAAYGPLRIAADGLTIDQIYQIQTTPSMTPPPLWTGTHTFTATGAVYTWSETIPGIVTSRFYRLVKP